MENVEQREFLYRGWDVRASWPIGRSIQIYLHRLYPDGVHTGALRIDRSSQQGYFETVMGAIDNLINDLESGIGGNTYKFDEGYKIGG